MDVGKKFHEKQKGDVRYLTSFPPPVLHVEGVERTATYTWLLWKTNGRYSKHLSTNLTALPLAPENGLFTIKFVIMCK